MPTHLHREPTAGVVLFVRGARVRRLRHIGVHVRVYEGL